MAESILERGLWKSTPYSRIFVRKNSAGAVAGARKRLNIIEGTNVTVTVADDEPNDEIDVTIAATGGDIEGAVTGSKRWFGVWQQNGIQATVSTVGMTAPTIVGTATSVQDSTGSYINYASTTLLNARAGWQLTGGGVFALQPQLLPDMTVVCKTGAAASDIAGVKFLVGFHDDGTVGTDTPGASGVNLVAFRYSTPAGDTNWQATTADAAADSVTDTGVAVATDTRYVLRIKMVTATLAEFYINTALVASISTTMPAAATSCILDAAAINRVAGTARNFRLRRLYVDAL